MHPSLAAAQELLEAKTADYQGGATDTEADPARLQYFPYGTTSYMHMIHTKWLRVQNILQAGGTPNFESIEDSLLDMINYTAFFHAFIAMQRQQREARDGQSAAE